MVYEKPVIQTEVNVGEKDTRGCGGYCSERYCPTRFCAKAYD